VPPINEVTRAVRKGEYTAPKTILGFFAIMISIAASTTVAAIGLLAGNARFGYLIPIILIIFVFIFLLVTITIMRIAWKDPSKLMLGRITGKDYAVIQRLTLGDSNAGEFVEAVVVDIDEVSAELQPRSAMSKKESGTSRQLTSPAASQSSEEGSSDL
jgi:hypothetical protein